MEKKTVKKVHRLYDILISGGIFALGLVFTFLVPSWAWLGITLLIVGAFMLPFYKTGYKIPSQKGIFIKKEVLLPSECKSDFAAYIEGSAEALDIDPFNKGGLLMEWYYNKDHSKQFGQLFDFENNVYTPQSKLSELDFAHISEILKYQS